MDLPNNAAANSSDDITSDYSGYHCLCTEEWRGTNCETGFRQLSPGRHPQHLCLLANFQPQHVTAQQSFSHSHDSAQQRHLLYFMLRAIKSLRTRQLWL